MLGPTVRAQVCNWAEEALRLRVNDDHEYGLPDETLELQPPLSDEVDPWQANRHDPDPDPESDADRGPVGPSSAPRPDLVPALRQALYVQTSSVLWGRATEAERLLTVEAFAPNRRVLQVEMANANSESPRRSAARRGGPRVG